MSRLSAPLPVGTRCLHGGSGHYNMQAKIDVVSQEDFHKLVAEKSKAAILSKLKAKDEDGE